MGCVQCTCTPQVAGPPGLADHVPINTCRPPTRLSFLLLAFVNEPGSFPKCTFWSIVSAQTGVGWEVGRLGWIGCPSLVASHRANRFSERPSLNSAPKPPSHLRSLCAPTPPCQGWCRRWVPKPTASLEIPSGCRCGSTAEPLRLGTTSLDWREIWHGCARRLGSGRARPLHSSTTGRQA